MGKLYLDFETRSRVDIKKVGAWAYASHPSTDITVIGFALNDGNVWTIKQQDLHRGIPPNFASRFIIAHSAQFEYAVYHFILHKRYGWPALLDPSKWDCTMARALMCGLPASLEGVALALKVPYQKDMDGRRAMYETCKPKADGTWCEDPAVLAKLYTYNRMDVETERAVDRVLPELPEQERKIFELDLVMNRRGVAIDLQSAGYAVKIAAQLTDNLNAQLRELTGGAVDKATQLASLKRWIAAQGVAIPTVKEKDENGNEIDKETLDKEAVGLFIKDAKTPQIVKDVVAIRQQVGKSSVAKFEAMLRGSCADGRVRGAFQYHGAHTGRWAGRLIQPQNYPQGLTGSEQDQAIELLAEPEMFAQIYNGQGMQTLSDCLRGCIVPAKGKIFLGADYNAIEARVVFWLANEVGALSMYARGESPYLEMGKLIFERAISKKDVNEYALAKMTVLGAGFGMGWVKFQGQAATRGVIVDDVLAQRAIKAYRGYYRNVVGMWYEMEAAAIRAVLNSTIPPAQITNGKVDWGMSKDLQFLLCRLPSGRLLRYFRPEIKTEETPYGEKQALYYWTAADKGAIKTECNGMLGKYRTWGGELVENIVQAIARDIMCHGMLNVEEDGYRIVLTVHDELIAEDVPLVEGVEKEEDAIKDFTTSMCQTPQWAKGCPIAAEGWIGHRYRK